jgi:hypothetical protein
MNKYEAVAFVFAAMSTATAVSWMAVGLGEDAHDGAPRHSRSRAWRSAWRASRTRSRRSPSR